MNKRNIITLAGVSTILFFGMFLNAKPLKLILCGTRGSFCWDVYNLFGVFLLLSPVLLISSLASLKASDEAFSKWKSMTLYFIPAYLLIVILTPWDMGNAMAGPSLSKGMVALVLCVIYLVFSVFYLLTKSRKTS